MIDPSFAQRAPRSQYGYSEEQPTWVGLKEARTINAQRNAVQPCTLDAVSALATTLRESTYAPMSVDLSFSSSRHTNSSGGATLETYASSSGSGPKFSKVSPLINQVKVDTLMRQRVCDFVSPVLYVPMIDCGRQIWLAHEGLSQVVDAMIWIETCCQHRVWA